MPANNITQLCQQAAKAFLDGEELSFINDAETQIVTGIASDDITLPLVVCQCQSASAAMPYEGNWSATLRIEVRSNSSDTTQDDHHANAGEVFGKFMDTPANMRQHLSSEELGFTCQNLWPERQGWELNDKSWASFMEFQVECAGSYFDVS